MKLEIFYEHSEYYFQHVNWMELFPGDAFIIVTNSMAREKIYVNSVVQDTLCSNTIYFVITKTNDNFYPMLTTLSDNNRLATVE